MASQIRLDVDHKLDVLGGMLRQRPVHLTGRLEALQRELPNRLEHEIPGIASCADLAMEQALVDQGRGDIEQINLRLAFEGDRGLEYLERKSAAERGHASDNALFIIVQQLITPSDGIPHGLLANGTSRAPPVRIGNA